MTVLDGPRFRDDGFADDRFGGPRFNGPVLDLAIDSGTGCGDCTTCACSGESATDDAPDTTDDRMPGFDTAIAMAEAAGCGNVSWWNDIRAHAGDSAVGEYAASMLLAQMIRESAHRWGVPVVDVWDAVRRTGRLPS
ncbi:hypothetical protein AAFP30_21075 [Gordonia sp. CPCC 205515]|uniref:hypothetical protein n=1 Tax=Gordonia sp. CPCC 205515 TaxID=3140791 RepID=UPI003AF38322